MCRTQLSGRKQIAEAVSRRVPQSRRISRGLHAGHRASASSPRSRRNGCASAAIGIRAAACRSTSSIRPARRPMGCGCPIRASPPIADVGELQARTHRSAPSALELGFDAVGFRARRACRSRGAPAVWRLSRARPSRRYGLAGARRADRRAPPESSVARGAERHRARPQLWARRRSAGGSRHSPSAAAISRLCPRQRLSRCDQDAAEGAWRAGCAARHGGALKVFVDTAPVMEKPLAERGRPRLAGQAHQSGVARLRLLAVPRRDLHHARSAARRAARPIIAALPHLPGCLPDQAFPGALPARCAALHLLSDHRA